MIINELPNWLPFFNIGISLAALFFVILLLLYGKKDNRFLHITLLFAVIVLVAGALFQANLIGIGAWTILGTGGRIATAVFLLVSFAREH